MHQHAITQGHLPIHAKDAQGQYNRALVHADIGRQRGQGYAHPRRFGLASHVGLLLDRPSLGCAKSLLVGACDTPGMLRGSTSPIEHEGECIGMALRTRDDVKPVYVSVGHRLSLRAAVEITLTACAGFRIPEPTRLADRLVARRKSGVRIDPG